jgi:23S rRNA pseudouridine2457 synthase
MKQKEQKKFNPSSKRKFGNKKKHNKAKPRPEKLYYFLINKPYGMLSQFTPMDKKPTLADLYSFPSKDIYSIGRLDADSEGLLILTNDGQLKQRLQDPSYAHDKTYWAQVEGEATQEALDQLSKGVEISIKGNKYQTLPGKAGFLPESVSSKIPERTPPVRPYLPKTWIELTIHEGKNRQVRRMTAAVGLPCLRLIRFAVERITLNDLKDDTVREVNLQWILDRI